MMSIQYWFTLFAISQGCAVLGLTVFIFSYYIPKNKMEMKSDLRWHIVVVSLSYILLTIATIKTSLVGFYDGGNIWYYLVTMAYISGDIALILVFRHAVRKEKLEKFKNKNL